MVKKVVKIKMHKKAEQHAKEVSQKEIEQENVSQTPDTEIIEKIVYKKQRVHGFFRTLTILVVLVVGFLLLGESMNIAKLSIGDFRLDIIYPIIIIFSTIVIRSYRGVFGKLFGLILFLGVFGGFFTIRTYNGLNDKKEIKFGEPIYFVLTGENRNSINIDLLAGDIEMEGNVKSPYLQGTRTSDREMVSSVSTNNGENKIIIKDDNNLNLLQDFISHLTMYIPSQTTFNTIYIRNGRGNIAINTEYMHRKKLIIHGGANIVTLNIPDSDPNAQIEIQGVIQKIDLTLPKTIGVKLEYEHKIGLKNMGDLQYSTGHIYTSANIQKAKKIINIKVNVVLDKFHINWE